ncbi:MAG: DUF305 domain-containing protein [Gemmatimonadota bacterium]
MTRYLPRSLAGSCFTIAALLSLPGTLAAQGAAAAKPDGRLAYVPADVTFMTGMIGHHAQAVLIGGWAPTHGASKSLQALCERIVVGQRDEILTMQTWLKDHHEPVPAVDPEMGNMPGMDESGLMPGMLSYEELHALDQARGTEFDRLFLTDMIKHHNGAITMVNTLFGTPGGGEEERMYKIASDIYADQTTEIDRMTKMLAALPQQGHGQ